MRLETIDISIDYQKLGLDNSGYQPKLHAYCPDNSLAFCPNKLRPTIVICPGGGYCNTSDREAEPIALRFAAAGFNAFVLRYSTSSNGGLKFPGQLFELCEAVAYVRKHAAQYHVDPSKVVACGFSAGGHLVGSLAAYWNANFVKEALGYQNGENRPDGTIFCYPVVTADQTQSWHIESFYNLVGEDRVAQLYKTLSVEKNINADTPPAFIWHTNDDECVPVMNSIILMQALDAHNIPFEAHIYPHGVHGLSLATETTAYPTENGERNPWIEPACQEWISKAIAWVESL